MTCRLRGVAARLAAVAGALSLSGIAQAQQAPSSFASAQASAGLIVKLRNAPAHAGGVATRAGIEGAGALGLASANARAQAHAQADRVRHVLADAGLGTAKLRPAGRAAHVLDFGHLLNAADAQRMAAQLRQQPEVEWVALNERERPLNVPGDPYFAATATSAGQWWMRPVSGSNANALRDRLRGVPGLQTAWLNTTGSANTVVAVLDTGITVHADLDAHVVLPGHDFVSETAYANDGDGRDADPSDPGDWVSQSDKDANPALFGNCEVANSSWHGTVIAGIVAALTDNGIGVAGINWDGRVLPVRVAGKCGAEVADIVDGMRWAAGLAVDGAPTNANPARVVNISFGGSAACNAAYQEAIDELRGLGVVVVAAAGNGHGDVKRPASCQGVIGVAALNRDGFKASYSSFGPAVVASTVGGDPPDEGVWGPLLGDDGLLTLDNMGLRGPEGATYSAAAGTSFAAPVVAGVVSLMLSANPGLSVQQIIDGLRLTARPHAASTLMVACSAQNPGRCACTTDTCGAGMLDATQALIYAADPARYVPPAQTPANIDSADVAAAVALGADRPPNAAPAPAASDSGGGGGAMNGRWLALLAAAVVALSASCRPRPTGRKARSPCPRPSR